MTDLEYEVEEGGGGCHETECEGGLVNRDVVVGFHVMTDMDITSCDKEERVGSVS